MAFVRALRGHTRQVTAAVLDPGSGKLYTGSQDGSVRQWDVESGVPGPTVEVGGEVDSLLLEGGWLFVGLHAPPPHPGGPPGPGTIAAYNLASGATARLTGHTGAVLCLAAAAGALFSGGQDATIRAWRWDEATATFAPAAVLDARAGGHAAPVQALAPAGPWLVSGDWAGTLKVWDLAGGVCAQTLPGAHASVAMAALAWEGHILSAGLDGTVKVWAPAPGAGSAPGVPVLESAPLYTHPPAEAGGGHNTRTSGGGGPSGGGSSSALGGVLALAGAADLDSKAVAFASHADDQCVRLWELPSFAERGCLGGVLDARAVAASAGGPGGGVVAVGDKKGLVKVWRWTRPGGGGGGGV